MGQWYVMNGVNRFHSIRVSEDLLKKSKLSIYIFECINNSFLQFCQMGSQKLGHPKSTDFVGSEYLCHLFIGSEVLLVFGILKIVLFQVSPQLLDNFCSRSFLFSNNRSQISGEFHWLRESSFLCHRQFL